MISAVVVLYNPNSNIIKNIESYVDFVDKLYIVDNSSISNESLFDNSKFISKISYLPNYKNLGIATALNIGCSRSIKEGMQWALTMDQDSRFSHFNANFFEDIKKKSDNIALYYPDYIINGEKYIYKIQENNEPMVVMTSGNIINLSIYEKVNGFEDKLFIDYVDIDYCLKLRENQFLIKNDSKFVMEHELGTSKLFKIGPLSFIVTNHSLVRRYYITRNRFYILKKYKDNKTFYNLEKKTILNDLFKVILFEKEKISKIKMMFRAYIDYKNDKFYEKQ